MPQETRPEPHPAFHEIAVVLVEPAGLRNIGSAARAMKNTGFRDLVIVSPPDFRVPEAYAMASNSREILDTARCFGSLEEALADRHTVFAVTARPRFKKSRLLPGEAASLWRRERGDGLKAALVFGPEDHGLSSHHVSLCRHLVGIPAHPDLTSFNLAQAVLLTCHAFFLERAAAMAGPPLPEENARPELSTHEDRVRIKEAAASLLREAGYMTPEREIPLDGTINRLVFGSEIETRDVRNILAAARHLRYVMKKI